MRKIWSDMSHGWLFFYMKDLLFFYVWNDFCKYSENIAERTFVVVLYWSDALYQSVPFEVSELAPKQFCRFLYIFFFSYAVPSRLSYRRSSPTERTQMTNGRRSTARHLHPHPPPRADALVALASRRRRRRCAGAWSVERGAATAAAEAASVDSIQFLFHFYLILCCCRWRWGAL